MGADRSKLPDVAADPTFTFPHIVHHVLSNGLRVRTLEHHSVPVVTMVMQIEGGFGADPPGHEGLAAITADMVDEGTGALSALDVSDALMRIGAEYDLDVGPDATVFALTTLARFAQRGAGLLADILTTPSLRADDFERVRQLRLDRVRQLKDLPDVVADRAFLRLLYPNHPYGHLSIGSTASLRALTLSHARGFHGAAFQPGRATMIIAGAMPHDEMRRLAEEAFGRWTPPASDLTLTDAAHIEPNADPPRLVLVPRDGAAQSELCIGQLSARRDTPDHAALLVMNAVLGGQFVSRINLKLREEKGFTYGARTGFDWRRGLGPFAMHASVHTAATAEAIGDALAEFAAIRGTRPPSAAELTLAKASLTRGYPRNFETAQQVARSVGQLALYGLPDTYFEDFVPRINAVTTEQVVSAAERYLDPMRLTTLIVGDHAVIGASLKSLNLGEPQLMAADV
jgi:predicted Zn-dependent peptidase